VNIDALNRIIELLKANDVFSEAQELEKLASKYYSSAIEEKREIANSIKSMCHPKWLGDIYIKDVSFKEWYALLDKLSKSV
jgi:hypothetical protein